MWCVRCFLLLSRHLFLTGRWAAFNQLKCSTSCCTGQLITSAVSYNDATLPLLLPTQEPRWPSERLTVPVFALKWSLKSSAPGWKMKTKCQCILAAAVWFCWFLVKTGIEASSSCHLRNEGIDWFSGSLMFYACLMNNKGQDVNTGCKKCIKILKPPQNIKITSRS